MIKLEHCLISEKTCLGREKSIACKTPICCIEESNDEREMALNIIDTIDTISASGFEEAYMVRLSSKLSYAADTINKNSQDELMSILPIIKRFALLLFEFRKKIIIDKSLSNVVYSFTQVIKGWFSNYFICDNYLHTTKNLSESRQIDLQSIELALELCALPEHDNSLDDIFF